MNFNSFYGGMKQDNAKSIPVKNSYILGENIKLLNDESLSSNVIVNIKGNEFTFSLPSTYNVYTLRIPFENTVTEVFVNGVSVQYAKTTETNEREVNAFFYKLLLDLLPGYTIGFDGLNISIYKEDIPNLMVISQANINLVKVASSQSTFLPMGTGMLRDDIILATTSNNQDGQFWKITYNELDIPTVKLIYHSDTLNFNQEFPITKLLGKYENEKIQKFYWTDFKNPLRSLNSVSSTIYLDNIDLIPSINFSQPVITNITDDGSLLAGMYSVTYRLSNSLGGESTFSRLSNEIFIVEDSETNLYDDYTGVIKDTDGNIITTNKAFEFTIDNLDSRFNFIEIAVVYRDNENGLPKITSIYKSSINGSDFTFQVTGGENNITDLTPEQFLIPLVNFTAVKDFDAYDNRLVVANVKTEEREFEYDARTYRYFNGISYTGNSNPFNKFSTEQQKFDRYFGSDDELNPIPGATDFIGGRGLNIAYSIITTTATLDTYAKTVRRGAPFIDGLKFNTQSVFGKEYQINGWQNYKNPLFASHFKTYKSNETYRFGIVFFDKYGSPLFTKWIEDIKFPDNDDMPITTYDSFLGRVMANIKGLKFKVRVPDDIRSKVSGFSIVRANRKDSDKSVLTQGMMNDFVRYDGNCRSNNWTFLNNKFFLYDRYSTLLDFRNSMGCGSPFGETELVASQLASSIDVPDFLFKGFKDVSTYKLRVNSAYDYVAEGSNLVRNTGDESAGQNNNSCVISNNTHGLLSKYYKKVASLFTNKYLDIENSRMIEARSSYLDTELEFGNAGASFNNFGNAISNAGGDYIATAYEKSLYVKHSDKTSIYQAIGDTSSNNCVNQSNTTKIIFDIVKDISKQYGGTDDASIANTEYISTGHYQAVDADTEYYDCIVFGGDTYVNLFDYQQGLINKTGFGGDEVEDYGRSAITIFPVESTVNIDIRQKVRVVNANKIPYNPVDTDIFNNYDTEPLLSSNNKLELYRGKPLNFIEVTEFDNRFYASEAKFNGETGDSWASFKVNNFLDVDGNYGPINKVMLFNDKFHFWQDRAFGIVSINPRAVVTTQDGFETQLGSGKVLDDYAYISNNVGTKHLFSVVQSPYSIIWWDILNKKVYEYGQTLEPISDTKELYNFFNTIDNSLLFKDNPLLNQGILGTYDNIENEFYLTFLNSKVIKDYVSSKRYYYGDLVKLNGQVYKVLEVTRKNTEPKLKLLEDYKGFTIGYSPAAKYFTAFYDFTPNIYINTRDKVISISPDNTYWLHNVGKRTSFYGKLYDLHLAYIVNDQYLGTNVYDNQIIASEYSIDNESIDKTFDWFEFSTDYQSTGIINSFTGTPPYLLDATINRVERDWKLYIPNNFDSYERLRDKFLRVDMHLINNGDSKFLLQYINTLYRNSAR